MVVSEDIFDEANWGLIGCLRVGVSPHKTEPAAIKEAKRRAKYTDSPVYVVTITGMAQRGDAPVKYRRVKR